MGHQFSVSVVIPCFGSPQFALAAFDSVVRQTLPFDQVILVNDDPGNVELRRIINESTRLGGPNWSRIENPTNLGIAESTLRGVQASRCDYVALLDMDDELTPSACARVSEVIATALSESIQPAALFSRRLDRGAGHEERDTTWLKMALHRSAAAAALEHTVTSHLKVFRRDVLTRLRVEESVSKIADWVWGVDLLLSGAVLVLIDEVLYVHRVHAGQTTHGLSSTTRSGLNLERARRLPTSRWLFSEDLDDLLQGAEIARTIAVCLESGIDCAIVVEEDACRILPFHPELPWTEIACATTRAVVIVPQAFVDLGAFALAAGRPEGIPIGTVADASRPETVTAASWSAAFLDFVVCCDLNAAVAIVADSSTPVVLVESGIKGAHLEATTRLQRRASMAFAQLGSLGNVLLPRGSRQRGFARRVYRRL